MIAAWKVNSILGVTVFLFTFFFSFHNNTWQTAFMRATIGFILFFILGYLVRFMLKLVLDSRKTELTNKRLAIKGKEEMENEQNSGDAESTFQAIPIQSLHTFDETINSVKTQSRVTEN